MIIKYGSYYISWYNLSTYEFGVDEIDRAYNFSDSEWEKVASELDLKCYEVER